MPVMSKQEYIKEACRIFNITHNFIMLLVLLLLKKTKEQKKDQIKRNPQ